MWSEERDGCLPSFGRHLKRRMGRFFVSVKENEKRPLSPDDEDHQGLTATYCINAGQKPLYVVAFGKENYFSTAQVHLYDVPAPTD